MDRLAISSLPRKIPFAYVYMHQFVHALCTVHRAKNVIVEWTGANSNRGKSLDWKMTAPVL
jgi:hypothetical protein